MFFHKENVTEVAVSEQQQLPLWSDFSLILSSVLNCAPSHPLSPESSLSFLLHLLPSPKFTFPQIDKRVPLGTFLGHKGLRGQPKDGNGPKGATAGTPLGDNSALRSHGDLNSHTRCGVRREEQDWKEPPDPSQKLRAQGRALAVLAAPTMSHPGPRVK